MRQDAFPLRGVRIMVVDDDRDALRVYQGYLTRSGALVETATDGIEGLRAMVQRDFDVLVVDAVMPEMSGADFIREVMALWPWVGIVMVTAHPDQAEAVPENVKRQLTDVLLKPVEFDRLARAVLQSAAQKKDRVMLAEPMSLQLAQRQMASLRTFTDRALFTDNLRESFRHLAEGLGLLSTSSVVAILHKGEETNLLMLDVLLPVSPAFLSKTQEEMIRRFEILSGQVSVRAGLDIVREGVACEESGPDTPANVFSIPLVMDNKVTGLVSLVSAYGDVLTGKDMAFLYQAAAQTATALLALGRIRQFALHDVLTGLLNRRGMEQQLEWVLESCKRRRAPMAIVVMDLDHFKALNDTHGHLVGDRLLEEMAALVRQEARTTDVVARYGGDEIVIALSDAGEPEASGFCERVLGRIRQHVFCADTLNLRLTASAGLTAGVPDKNADSALLSNMLAAADRALYEAKRAGRNRYKVWKEASQSASDISPAAAVAADTAVARERSEGRILIVDDEPVVLAWVSRVLSQAGYQVSGATTFTEAHLVLQESRGSNVDVVVTDVVLPDGNGFALAQRSAEPSRRSVL